MGKETAGRGVQPDKVTVTSMGNLGLAVDLGTTTIAVKLYDLNQGTLLSQRSAENLQRIHGRDVISRILYGERSPETLDILQQEAVTCINDSAMALLLENGVEIEALKKAVIVGNTTMMHFLFRQSAAALAEAPFSWEFMPPSTCPARLIGLKMAENGVLHTLPNISGHIGSDTTAALLYAGFHQSLGNRLLMDLGTNGELVLQAGTRLFACSTAVGPAFEAGSISCGMIAADGAIDRVSYGDDGVLQLHTINGLRPKGLCGSGLVDCVAALLNKGTIWADGHLNGNNERGFLLFPGERFGGKQLFLTQKDVRQLQLAKAAVFAGIQILMKCPGLLWEDLDQIFLAGAFGSVLSVESGRRIGLFPEISREKMITLGNAAGEGAAAVLLDGTLEETAAQMVRSVQRIELADDEQFQHLYIDAMDFKE